VSRLRQLLAASQDEEATRPRILSKNHAYQLNVASEGLDVFRFERLLVEGRAALEDPAADPARTAATLTEALALWRATSPLEDLRDQGRDEPRITWLESQRRAAVEAKAKADLMAGREADVIRELPIEIGNDRFNEHLRHCLMLALDRAGRAAEAVDVYFDFLQLLDNERGMRPSRELQQLHQDIQRQQVRDDYRPSAPPPSRPRPSRGRSSSAGRPSSGGCGRPWSAPAPARAAWSWSPARWGSARATSSGAWPPRSRPTARRSSGAASGRRTGRRPTGRG
jgi:DNA-binding SARP family transcriptional activator